jgi:superfamily II DNA or RNA helicase
MSNPTLRAGTIVSGAVLPEPIEIVAVIGLGEAVRLFGRGLQTGLARDIVLSAAQQAQLVVSAERPAFDGDARLFRLGLEAQRLGLAYEYDPFFSLSIAKVDPLPHQLEAVYEYFLKLPRIRFLLADDPGAGKTIMAGLLLKEMKARGLVKRTLVVAPANLTFQWQRELKDKFGESFEVMRGSVLRTNYGQNPWQERSQVVTSLSWVSRVEDARDSLLRSRWDLVIVDEAHKMAAYADDRKTLAYKLGEVLSELTDHYLLMTATPHKGDPTNFCLFLSLLDRDVYGSVESLEQAMRQNSAPFYLRRVKEALVSFPDPETGAVHKLFTEREVRTAAFELDGPELDFYDALSHYVEDQSILASQDDSARGRALGFTMAMLQRRMASTVYAVRRTLERMRARREGILVDPEKYRREQIERRLPDDFDDLTEEEQQEIIAQLEDVVASWNPADLRAEIAQLAALIERAKKLEQREGESKLVKLKAILTEQGVFSDPKTKLLVFTEHKDSLDFLVGDGQDGRPLGRLREWGLSVTQIHGSMKIGDRDAVGTRIWAEREFREHAQVMVATEAAGEGINLQFCWLMVNFDIPWNPVRLEQRVGRIHRYGQQHDCLIFNFVAANTREGRVLQKLLTRLAEIRQELGTDQVFDVVGEVFPSNLLERLFRELYARRLDVPGIEERIVREVTPGRFRAITSSALEGLAKRSLNLSAIIGKSVEARERRLVPEVIEQFFVEAGPEVGVHPKPTARDAHVYRIGRMPRTLLPVGDRLEGRYGRLAREYERVVFDKTLLKQDATLEWVTPGHPLFEAVREDLAARVENHLRRGAIFFDLHRSVPSVLDVFAASIKDGRGQCLHRRLFVVETSPDGEMTTRQPTFFLDVSPAPQQPAAETPSGPLPDRRFVEQFLYAHTLERWLAEAAGERSREVDRVADHVRISLDWLINRQNLVLADLCNRQVDGRTVPGLDGLIAQAEQHLDELNNRRDNRLRDLDMERHTTIGDLTHLGRAWVVPHPERGNPTLRPMVRDDEVEAVAVRVARDHEEARGWQVEDVQAENRGFDLISRRPHPEDPKTFTDVRFIEVKGRAGVGEIALTENEYRTAERLKAEYWLYAVFNCRAARPDLSTVQNPGRLGWKPVVTVEHYVVAPDVVRAAGGE